MTAHPNPALQPCAEFTEARQNPRFKLQVEIAVYSRRTGLLKGYTVDISEAGISAILTLEVAVDEIVQLEFQLPSGPVAIRAIVRHKTAFRYGFQFVEPDPGGIVKRTCAYLAAQSMKVQRSPNL